ncbi:NUDIX hydrolase [Lederbergia lenta]|nr:NUDIX hydrolase [Lederbergia lenta]MCM3109594.1 NUDIX hydrolase [Lederbergia lenta]MEC2324651.1 NUDIX hydrolase [Lederbergia lenta]
MLKTKNNGFEFIEFITIKEIELYNYLHLAGSYAVIKCDGKYLLCYNIYRKQWELPAGRREANESPKECAKRELFEETGQIVNDLEFKGLLKLRNKINGTIKYNPVYFWNIDQLDPFFKNEETSEIKLWNLGEEIGHSYIDEIDVRVVEYMYKLNSKSMEE